MFVYFAQNIFVLWRRNWGVDRWDRWTIGLHNREWKWKVKRELRDIVVFFRGGSEDNFGYDNFMYLDVHI